MATTTSSFLNRPEVRTWGPPIALFLIGILLVVLGTIPSWGKVQDLQSDIVAEQDRIVALNEKSRQLLDFSDQSIEIDKQFTVFDQAISSESQVPELLTQVQKISVACGVKVTTLQFGGEKEKTSGKLQEVRLQYASESSFSRLTCFLAAIEKASRLIEMESLRYSLSVNEDTGAQIVTAQSTLLSYYTPTPQLSPDNPLTFSLSDERFLKNIELLKEFKVY